MLTYHAGIRQLLPHELIIYYHQITAIARKKSGLKEVFRFTGLTYFFDKLTLFINDGETGLTVYIKGGNGDGKYEYKDPCCR